LVEVEVDQLVAQVLADWRGDAAVLRLASAALGHMRAFDADAVAFAAGGDGEVGRGVGDVGQALVEASGQAVGGEAVGPEAGDHVAGGEVGERPEGADAEAAQHVDEVGPPERDAVRREIPLRQFPQPCGRRSIPGRLPDVP
jgi:hypothetical protein